MKRKKIIVLSFFVSFTLFSQINEYNSNDKENDKLITENNVTKINLYTLDFDGKKIPINLTYDHTGIKVGGVRTRDNGLGWMIENIGFIQRSIQSIPDDASNGWFNTPLPNLSSFTTTVNLADQSGCSYNGSDLSPDFFSCRTVSNLNFDFLYKKDPLGLITPTIIRNSEGVKLDTNFANFTTQPTQNSNQTIFNIYDNTGVKYNFINGPNLMDYIFGNNSYRRNNYYLQSLVSKNNTETLFIEYYSRNYPLRSKDNWMASSTGTAGYDYDNFIIKDSNITQSSFNIDDSHFDIKRITSGNTIIDFLYNSFDFLTEINITNNNGEYITGYSFEYFQGNDISGLIKKIKKFNNLKTNTEDIFQFEYFIDEPEVDYAFSYDSSWVGDYLGYYNNTQNSNCFPFPIRNSINNSITPAGNLSPNLYGAKQLSLKKLTNKFGGITLFDYRLNAEYQYLYDQQIVYGGGILLQSKTYLNPNGESDVINYNYYYLTGYGVVGTQCNLDYESGTRLYTSLPKTREFTPIYGANWIDAPIANASDRGNFYCIVDSVRWDGINSSLSSSHTKYYYYTSEGFFTSPRLRQEEYYGTNGLVRKKIYDYSFNQLTTVNRAVTKTHNYRHSGDYFCSTRVINQPIRVNREKLISFRDIYYDSNFVKENFNYNYINDNDNIPRSKISINSTNGEVFEERFFYPFDAQVASEPFITDLVAKNMIGIPLKIETYNGTEKISEQKTVFAKDASTNNLLLPKFIYAKKGTDSNATLEKKLTYDLYDDKGNILQFTLENGVSNVTIWGYNKTQPLAQIENIQYSNVSSYVANLQTLSNADNDTCTSGTCNEQLLRNALNSLRTTLASSYPNARMTTYTYNTLVGVTSVTDAKSDVQYYIYDSFQRLIKVVDKDNKIVSESAYNYKPQN